MTLSDYLAVAAGYLALKLGFVLFTLIVGIAAWGLWEEVMSILNLIFSK
jgi:hypothetical protein